MQQRMDGMVWCLQGGVLPLPHRPIQRSVTGVIMIVQACKGRLSEGRQLQKDNILTIVNIRSVMYDRSARRGREGGKGDRDGQ